MKRSRIRRILVAAVPVAIALAGLTPGLASAMPDNHCEDLLNQENSYYSKWQMWDALGDAAQAAGYMDVAIDDDIEGLKNYYSYQDVLGQAGMDGCY